ncbi:hypothetical protein CerSpe_147080 [Prunus speciosa]
MDDDCLVLTLFNPFTRHTILLPPVKDPESLDVSWDYFCIAKVVLSADPSLFPNDFEALILCHDFYTVVSEVSHFKGGDDTWTHMDTIDTSTRLSDVIYHQGQFRAVTQNGSQEPVYKVVLCDFGDDGGPQWVEIGV